MESWRKVWRDGFVPQLSMEALKALRYALMEDIEELAQCYTVSPPPAEMFKNDEPEKACAIGYMGWKADGCETVGAVEAFFTKACLGCDDAMQEHAACRHFLNWFDETPREIMRRELLPEVNLAIQQKEAEVAA